MNKRFRSTWRNSAGVRATGLAMLGVAAPVSASLAAPVVTTSLAVAAVLRRSLPE
ncbi:MAG: hypothetical protein V7603_4992 [Micromonosporaceae bacterium]